MLVEIGLSEKNREPWMIIEKEHGVVQAKYP